MREERFKERDAWISGIHRRFGNDIAMLDIDFLAIEYFKRSPNALVEMKYAAPGVENFVNSPGADVIRGLAKNLPAFLLTYKHSYDGWKVYALNDIGQGFLGGKCKEMTAYDYAMWLHTIRGITANDEQKDAIREGIQRYIEDNALMAQEIERKFK